MSKISLSLLGLFIGGGVGITISSLLFVPAIMFMGFDWTMDFMYSDSHAIVYRVLSLFFGVIGMIAGYFWDEEEKNE